jgi:toxin-antitoxin system PIN domain toxin
VRSLLDVNVLLAMFDEDHVHHERAHAWWDLNNGDGWASCPLTQNGFVRIFSQPSYRGGGTSAAAGLDLLREASSKSDHVFWSDDISLLDVDRFNPERILGPKQLTDIYLLGLAVKNGGQLVTFDRAISRRAVIIAEPVHLVVI